MRKYYIVIILLACLTVNIKAAAPECVFERYTSLDGLSHNSIADIYKDSKGFIWICSWHGLSRFDGHTFKNYRTLPGDYSPLTHNRFLKVTEDAKGFLWITTYDHRIFRFNRHTEVFEDIPATIPEFSANYKTDHILCASDGRTWIALAGKGMICFEEKDGATSIVSYIGDTNVGTMISHIYEDPDGRIFTVSESGITLFTNNGHDDFTPTLISRENIISDIHTCNGLVYFAAQDRLIAFNGDTRKQKEINLPFADKSTALSSSPSGDILYVGTSRSGMIRFDTKKFTFLTGPSLQARVRYLHTDSKGTVWITTYQDGITRYDPEKNNFKRFVHQRNVAPYYIDTMTKVVEAGEVVWMKMNGYGFGYYDREADNVETFYNAPGERYQNGIPCFTIDSTNVLWMSTAARALEKVTIIDQKAHKLVPDTRHPISIASSEIRAMYADSKKNIWIANKDNEIFCYDSLGRQAYYLPDQRSGDIGMVYTIKEDSKGNLWFGTKGDGITRVTPMPNGGYGYRKFRHDPNNRYSLQNDQIYSIEEDHQGKIWFGTYGGGICMLENADSERFTTPFNNFPDYPTQQGDKVRYIHCTPEGIMLVATVEGVIMFDPDNDPESISFNLVQKIAGDPNSLGNNDVIHIMTDSSGRTWLSTFGGGFNRLSEFGKGKEPRFEILSMDHGLSSNIILSATEDHEGNLWLATENGISKLDTSTWTFTNYTDYDGIRPGIFSEATAITDHKGRVMFGTTDNVYVLDPSQISKNEGPANLFFTNLQIDNKDVPVGDGSPLSTSIVDAGKITLPYDYSVFRLQFASLNFRTQSKTDYMYILDGYDKEWNITKNVNSASYSNVPHGNYKFRVKTVGDNINGNSDEISIALTILPPPWKTTWAYIVYALTLVLLTWLIFRTLYTMISLRNKVNLERKMTELKLRFFTNISHELRTPLTLILGGVEDVHKREALSSRGEHNISLAEKNAKRMLSLINQLLDFRKIVNDKMKLKISRCDIVKIAENIVNDFKEVAKERNIELLFAVSHKSLFVWIDQQRVEGVIYNLLSNAFKFTPDGKKISLSISHRETEDHFTICVSDTGIGIPKDKQPQIFDRFVQVSDAVSSKMRGSGIGLALSKEIIEMHHGQIWVDSKQGEGADFCVKLLTGNSHFTMDQIDFTQEQAYSGTSEYMTISANQNGGKRTDIMPSQDAQKILLVEDNHELRIFIYNNLIESYNVVEANDGEDALEKLKGFTPDIIITDLMMPKMDGIEFTNRIRKNFDTSHIPIIMLTAKHESEIRTKAMKYGADGYITKPFSMELLLARIDNLLTQRRNLFEKYSSKRAKVVDLSPGEIVVTDKDEQFISSVMKWIDDNIENPEVTIDQLAAYLGMGRTTMYNKIKGLTGKSPVEIIKEYRVTKARMLLNSGQFTVSEAAYKVGFSDPGYFSKCFKEQYKMSPAEFLKNNRKN